MKLTPAALSKIRDELANEAFQKRIGQIPDLHNDIQIVFKEGFDAASSEWQKIAEELVLALRFYSEAKILFLSRDGLMPKAKDERFGVLGGFEESPCHIKDDGKIAREALAKYHEQVGEK